MAKAKGSSSASKVTFGKKKKGVAKKSFNKHDRSEKNYRTRKILIFIEYDNNRTISQT